ncbi:MAG: HlyD family secretion protein [Dethiobacter sp.]|jgi:multidrug resistance efflux pump|nr:HlyD family secretion protein [Dethiobacter sp.]
MEDFKSIVVDSAATEVSVESRSRGVKGKVTVSIKALVSVLVVILLLATVGAGVYFYIDYADQWISTNNAFVDGRIYAVAALFPGSVEEIHVAEGARVTKDEPLATIDSALQSLAVRKIEAALRTNDLTIEKLDFQPATAPELELARARRDELNLFLEEARFIYRQTNVLSPADGYVAHLQVEAGEYAMTGQTIMSVVNLDDLWISANFSEEQVRHLRVGQEVDIYVDAYPDEQLRGTVANIMPAGGSAFALFPPDATAGNWVRVSQRIPVKIVFADDGNKEDLRLKIGMSATVRVER